MVVLFLIFWRNLHTVFKVRLFFKMPSCPSSRELERSNRRLFGASTGGDNKNQRKKPLFLYPERRGSGGPSVGHAVSHHSQLEFLLPKFFWSFSVCFSSQRRHFTYNACKKIGPRLNSENFRPPAGGKSPWKVDWGSQLGLSYAVALWVLDPSVRQHYQGSSWRGGWAGRIRTQDGVCFLAERERNVYPSPLGP